MIQPRYHIDRHYVLENNNYRWVVVDWESGKPINGLSFTIAEDALDYCRSLNKSPAVDKDARHYDRVNTLEVSDDPSIKYLRVKLGKDWTHEFSVDELRMLAKERLKCEIFERTTVHDPRSGLSLELAFGNKGTVRVEFDHPVEGKKK